METKVDNKGNSRFARFLNGIERIGNKLPDPFILFVSLAVIVIILSWFISLFDVTFKQPGNGEEVAIKSLLSKEGFQFILTSMLDNFVGFKPLGIVLTMMLGIGLANKVGLLETFIKHTIMRAPKSLITYAVVFTGIVGNIAGDASFVIIPPLAAMVFYNVGRHPLAGLAAGFAGVGSGFTANLLVTNTDAVMSGISAEVMESMGAAVTVTPIDNWYFMIASTLVLSVVGAWITEKIVEPRLGAYEGDMKKEFHEPTPLEKKGLRNAGIAMLIYVGLLLVLIFLPDSPLRNENGGLIPSPLLAGIVPIVTFFFITIAISYGVTTKKIDSAKAIPRYMGESMKDMSGFIVLIFAAAQFIAYFEWSNIGSWLAVSGANFLQSVGITGIIVVVAFTLLTALMNLFIFSGSALWALEAPVFLKMFYLLGYHPAFIQAAYRIAESSTNTITPMNPYFVVVLGFMREYDKKAGLGTLISLMLPYNLIFLAVWIILLLLFVFLGIPFGPGVNVHY